MPDYTAIIVKHPASENWQAVYYVYDALKQKWTRKMQSTKTTKKGKAEVIANMFQEVALRASGQASDSNISREYILGVLNTILRISGHKEVEETRRWDEYAQVWLKLQEGRDELADTSKESYAGHIRSFTTWLGTDKNTPLNVLTGDILQTWYEDRIDEGRKPKTVNNAVKTVQAVFDRARAEGFVTRNPAELIIRQYGEADVREPFTLEDIEKILAYLRDPELVEWLTVALLGLCTGQRLQDCASADISAFRLFGEHLVWYVDQGKGGKKVDIPIVEPLASHLLKIKKEKKAGLLAPTLAGVPSGGTNGLSMQFSAILDAAGIVRVKREKEEDSKGQSWTNKTFHSFRHTTNSLLANAGISDDVRRKITGHSTLAMNLRYTHMEIKTLAEALKKAMPTLAKAV